MIVTEEQAKAKWCPEARVESDDGQGVGSVNRDFGKGHALSDCMCLASGCMLWRWAEYLDDSPKRRRGYCGKAGAPIHA